MKNRRVIGRAVARELTAAELAEVGGAHSHNVCPPGTPTVQIPGFTDNPAYFTCNGGQPSDFADPSLGF